MNLERSRGVTLIELLIGVAVGAIVTLAVVAAWGISVRSASYSLESARLNNDLRSAMQIMSQDVRRADGGVDIPDEFAVQFGGDGDCITYFVEGLGRGFRLNDAGLFQIYFTENPTDRPTCVDNNNWVALYEDLSEGGFSITDFSVAWRVTCYPFDELDPIVENDSSADIAVFPRCRDGGGPMTDVTEVLEVTLSLTGEIGTSSGIKNMTLNDVVMVRNHDVR
ncbi:type II secretion system protein J [Thioalkalivibrio sp. XN279]|uniref:PulJ/GspJ family protein n=1 Tax=Thioalkalivibrio sp. XN279 TaxID=2714953 RepID=UPI00140D1593|nr:prepilin-type N-terminal cleavage/methylation domain-containing protein [Thioalkalivibrio sp. XN279]NHA15872.1 prepilin-type N-terminal cleavage/methylation domain-containing protein [Thioalkalivibrio sp. XN279]